MSLENEINRLKRAKTDIRASLKTKIGLDIPEETTLDKYGECINNVESTCHHVNGDFYNLRTKNGTDYSGLFYNHNGTNLDLSNWDTSKVTNMSYMFVYCRYLTSLDVSNFDTSKVTNMSNMFNSCDDLTTLDLSNWNTSKVTDMSNMFYNCDNLTSLDLSNFDTSQVTNMSYMFCFCKDLTTLDLSNFNTSNVTHMNSMFWYCESLTSLDLSSFNTSKVTSFTNMLSDVPSNCTIYINPETFINKNTGKTFTPSELGWTGTFTERIVINPITPPIDPTDPSKPLPPA